MDPTHITPRRLMFRLLGLFVVLFAVVGLTRAGGDPLVNTPPPKPVRIPAEFEPMQAVIASPDIRSDALYRYIAEDVKLIALYESEGADRGLFQQANQLLRHTLPCGACGFAEQGAVHQLADRQSQGLCPYHGS